MYLLALEFDDLKDLFQVKHYAIPTHNFIFHFSLLSKTLPASPFSVVRILDYGYFKSKIYIVLLKEENPVKKHFMKPINLFYTRYPWNTTLNAFLHQI